MDLQKRDSAGIVFYRRAPNELQLLVHPGGPYWRNRLEGAWQIPKGAIGSGEAPDAAALREVAEEVGIAVSGPLGPLGTIRQAGGKAFTAFAVEQEIDPASIVSNRFELAWPPLSGTCQSFPEIDAARWLALAEAREAILPSQRPLPTRLRAILGGRDREAGRPWPGRRPRAAHSCRTSPFRFTAHSARFRAARKLQHLRSG
ncbi:NUDIX domain-containing protein [Sphingopyxis chilensis]